MKKILSLLLSVMLVASIISVPVMADGTESEFTPEFIGIGSAGVAYDDLTLPQATANGDAITWSTTTTDVIEIVDNTTAKIKKYVEDAQLDANVVATVNGIDNTIAFKVEYIYGKTISQIKNDTFDSGTTGMGVRSSSGTYINDNGRIKYTKNTEKTDTGVDFYYLLSSSYTSGQNGIFLISFETEFDTSVISASSPLRFRLASPAGITNTPSVEFEIDTTGEFSVYGETSDSVVSKCILNTSEVNTISFSADIIVDFGSATWSLIINNNLVAFNCQFRSTSLTGFKNFRIYNNKNSSINGNVYLDNVVVKSITDTYAGLEQSTINPVEEGGDTSIISAPLTLPAATTAGNSVSWVSADNSFAIDGATATGNASYFATKAGSLTAKATNDGVEYVKNYSFTIPAVEFPATTTALVTGDKAAGGTLTAAISGLTSTSDILTAIIGVYNGNELVAIKLAPQAVTGGKLTVTTDALGSDVSAESDVKVFVLDSANTANPLTKVTVQ